MNNEYCKNCPHCEKDFRARRLNQTYCTYRCKVRFNNERARLRRLNFLEIEKAYLASNTVPVPKEKEIKKSESVPNPNQPITKVKESPTSNWKNMAFIGLALLVVGSIIYWMLQWFNKKEREISPAETLAQNLMQFPMNQNPEDLPPIPVDIFPKSMREHPFDPNKSTTKVEKNLSQTFYKEHPDITAYKKILNSNKVI